MNTSLVENGTVGGVLPVEENLTAKGAQKKRAKPGNGKKQNKVSQTFKKIGKFFEKAYKEVKKPVNKVLNRTVFAVDDLIGYEGKDTMVKSKSTVNQENQTDYSQYIMIGGLVAGGILIYYLIQSSSQVPQNIQYTQ